MGVGSYCPECCPNGVQKTWKLTLLGVPDPWNGYSVLVENTVDCAWEGTDEHGCKSTLRCGEGLPGKTVWTAVVMAWVAAEDDCVPILQGDTTGGGAVHCIHGGWMEAMGAMFPPDDFVISVTVPS